MWFLFLLLSSFDWAGYFTGDSRLTLVLTKEFASLGQDMAHLCRDADTIQELNPEDLLGGQLVSGTLDLNHPDRPLSRTPGRQVREAAPRAPVVSDHPLQHRGQTQRIKAEDELPQRLL